MWMAERKDMAMGKTLCTDIKFFKLTFGLKSTKHINFLMNSEYIKSKDFMFFMNGIQALDSQSHASIFRKALKTYRTISATLWLTWVLNFILFDVVTRFMEKMKKNLYFQSSVFVLYSY